MLRWNQPIFTEYLRQCDPALIVLAYGDERGGQSQLDLRGLQVADGALDRHAARDRAGCVRSW